MDFVAQSKLLNGEQYIVRKLTVDKIDQILMLQREVISHLNESSFLQPLTKEEYTFILNGNGFIFGCFIHEKLIALRALLAPEINEDHLGLEAGLTVDQLHKVIYQEISLVHPHFRGHRLQQKLGQLIMSYLKKSEQPYRYVCATVAPFNFPSLIDKFRQNMVITSLKQIYGGKWRYIFFKSLLHDKANITTVEKVVMTNFQTQQNLLKNNAVGYSLVKENGKYYILFGK